MSTIHDPFATLLLDPPGTYALSSFGGTKAIVLRGDATFRHRGYNLFVSLGGQSNHNARAETPLPQLHLTDDPDVVWFCMPEERVTLALALYLNAQLVRANTREVRDADGDFVEVVCDNEAALWEQAQQQAVDFVAWHMQPDYRALPSYEFDPLAVEHRLGAIDAGGSDD